jgi:hypothetical protein
MTPCLSQDTYPRYNILTILTMGLESTKRNKIHAEKTFLREKNDMPCFHILTDNWVAFEFQIEADAKNIPWEMVLGLHNVDVEDMDIVF